VADKNGNRGGWARVAPPHLPPYFDWAVLILLDRSVRRADCVQNIGGSQRHPGPAGPCYPVNVCGRVRHWPAQVHIVVECPGSRCGPDGRRRMTAMACWPARSEACGKAGNARITCWVGWTPKSRTVPGRRPRTALGAGVSRNFEARVPLRDTAVGCMEYPTYSADVDPRLRWAVVEILVVSGRDFTGVAGRR
jgi:hypothetical protein